jgi:DNA invertase Pin-like site-specific DNA recombinase
MRTAAAYARYSTDDQRPTSIEDQVRRCRQLAKQKGYAVEEKWLFTDSAISGATKGNGKRLAFVQLLDAIEAREVDVLFIDEVSRVARNYLDGARIIDLVERTGLRVVTDDGIDSEDQNWQLMWSFKLMAAVQQVQSTASEVVRSMVGQLERGYMIAQAPIGYIAEQVRDSDGRKQGTLWRPDAKNAALIMRMYEWRYEGMSLLRIATRLNDEGVPCPGQRRCKGPAYWRPATVGRVLANTVYKGVFVWNGSAYARAKARKRRKTLEPKAYDRPALRLVSDEVWAACNPSAGKESFRGGGKHALSGVIRCGHCKARLSIGGGPKSFHVACPQCEQAKMVNNAQHFIGYTSLEAVKRAMNWGLQQVFTGEARAEFRERLRQRLTQGPAKEEAELERRMKELEAAKERIRMLLKDPRTPEDWLKEEMIEVSGEMDSVTKRLKAIRKQASSVTKELVDAQIGVDPLLFLNQLLAGEPAPFKVRAVLQRLISRFEFVARKAKGHSVFELEFKPGVLAAELSGTDLVDNTSVAFRIEAVTTAKRPVSWEVNGERI